MKKLALYFAILTAIIISFPFTMALAATTTPSSTPIETDATKKIEDLKERIATKVAQLKTTQRRAIYGTVKTVSITSFTVETPTKDLKIELTDDITVIQYLKGKRTTLSPSDISKGDTVVVFGQFDTTLDLLTARVVFIQGALPQHTAGTVTNKDDKEFTLSVTTPQGQVMTIDIEKTTRITLWDREKKELVKSGFSAITTGSTIHVMGSPVPKVDNRISADRILNLGNLASPAGQAALPTPTPAEQEATTGATPTKKPTATPTKKPTATPTP